MKYCLLIIFSFWITAARAQYYNTGTAPATVKWRQIKTDKFTLIYPQEIDLLAQRYAWLLDRSYRAVAAPLQTELSRLPVVLQPYNIYSNGVVAWAPRRMELYTTPSTSGYAQMWDKQLVLHETRHVAQMNKLHHGVFKYLHYLFGEQSKGLAAGVYLDDWFMEGDATVAETALSFTGRGRQPEFLMPVKAFLLSGTKFSWDEWLNGSYRYNPPNVYQIGYLVSAYAYQQAGAHIFGQMLDYTAHHPLHIPTTSNGLRKHGGFSKSELFTHTFIQVEQAWRDDDWEKKKDDSGIARLAFPEGERYRSYRSMVAVDTHTVVAVRTDLKKQRRLVSVDRHGNERFLKYIGQMNSSLKKHDRLLYWTASVRHERWEQVSYSILQSYNLTTHQIRRLTARTRYFAPAPSPDGQYVAVIENTPQGVHYLVLLNTADYAPHRRIAIAPGTVPKEMTWSADARRLFCSVLSDEGMGIAQFDLASQTWEPLLPNGRAGINRLATYRHFVLFESGYNGTNNIYALNTDTRAVFRVTDVRFGAFDPAVSADSSRLLFANYIPAGYTVAAIPLNEAAWVATDFHTPERFELADAVAALSDFNIDTLSIPAQPMYPSTRYNSLTHLFRIHSWTPFYYNPDALMSAALDKELLLRNVGLGATVLSQNSLGSMEARLGYKYSGGFHSGHLTCTYRGWYPVIDFTLDVNERNRRAYRIDTLDNALWNFVSETGQPAVNSSLRLYIPWYFTHGAWHTTLVPQVEYHLSNDKYRSFDPSQPYYDSFRHNHYVRAGLTLTRQLAPAVRDIFPRWGYTVRLLHSNPITSRNIFHAVTSLQASFYTPGLLANHGLLVTAGYQQRDVTSKYKHMTFSHLTFPRGYDTYATQELVKATVDYTFPLCYPDVNFKDILYIKRLRATLFGDYAHAKYNSVARQNLVSVGIDVLVDYHFLQISVPLSTGFRCVWPLTGQRTFPSINLLFDITL